jgi:arsenate reductase
MENITIYHNPHCSKSRCVLDWLSANNTSFTVRNYLKDPISINELKELTKCIKCSPIELVRTKEKDFVLHVKDNYTNDEELYAFIVKYPKLIQRPIVLWDGIGVVAWPLEKLIEIVDLNKKNKAKNEK